MKIQVFPIISSVTIRELDAVKLLGAVRAFYKVVVRTYLKEKNPDESDVLVIKPSFYQSSKGVALRCEIQICRSWIGGLVARNEQIFMATFLTDGSIHTRSLDIAEKFSNVVEMALEKLSVPIHDAIAA